MKNRVRIENSDNLVTNAGVWLRDDDDNWVDIRHSVTAISVDLTVGAVGTTTLKLLPTEALVESGWISPSTEIAFADVLRAMGWKVERP